MEQKFKEWTIKKCIGGGAFGKVYLIEREEFGNVYQAALKVIKVPKDSQELKAVRHDGMTEENVTEYFYGMVERIVDEFTLMSKLKGNSNIVSYEDHYVEKQEDGVGWTVYIRMEYLTSFYDYISTKTLTVKDVIKLGIDICHALESCQRYNIIHRDIKPENIFISDLGDFKLGDFGIARELEKTASNLSKVGTMGYIAPEVFLGRDYDSTVDIYSLGIVMYRYLNQNRMPFLPPAPEKISIVDKERADGMRLSGQKMPKPCNAEGRLAEIVLKACAYEPKDRYESAGDMRRALEEIVYTEGERSLVYPQGDQLENSAVEYVSEQQKTEALNFGNVSEQGDATVYLFQQPVEDKVLTESEDVPEIQKDSLQNVEAEDQQAEQVHIEKLDSNPEIQNRQQEGSEKEEKNEQKPVLKENQEEREKKDEQKPVLRESQEEKKEQNALLQNFQEEKHDLQDSIPEQTETGYGKKSFKIGNEKIIFMIAGFAIVISVIVYLLASGPRGSGSEVAEQEQDFSAIEGKYIYFGNYRQDDTNGDGSVDTGDVKKPVRWLVLDVNGKTALLLSEKILKVQPYMVPGKMTLWEGCSLRSWLNSNFYSDAFNTQEKEAVVWTKISTPSEKIKQYAIVQGNQDTMDRVFALSEKEYSKFLSSGLKPEAVAESTLAAKKESELGILGWWVRDGGVVAATSDIRNDLVAVQAGELFYHGQLYDNRNALKFGARPALYLDLTKSVWKEAGE